jgi:hypothetical protein
LSPTARNVFILGVEPVRAAEVLEQPARPKATLKLRLNPAATLKVRRHAGVLRVLMAAVSSS